MTGCRKRPALLRLDEVSPPRVASAVWYGLIECAVHVHRQVVTSRQLAPPAV